MERDEFTKIIREEADHCCNLLAAKGAEYDDDKADRLNSFKRAGKLQNENEVKALSGMMAKHAVSVFDMCVRGKPTDYSISKWDEKITDMINYLLILKAMVVEEYSAASRGTVEDEKGDQK
jgi:hypothetical protein